MHAIHLAISSAELGKTRSAVFIAVRLYGTQIPLKPVWIRPRRANYPENHGKLIARPDTFPRRAEVGDLVTSLPSVCRAHDVMSTVVAEPAGCVR